jgi:hypothetical protein
MDIESTSAEHRKPESICHLKLPQNIPRLNFTRIYQTKFVFLEKLAADDKAASENLAYAGFVACLWVGYLCV